MSDFEFAMEEEPLRCRVKEGYGEEGKEGKYFGYVYIDGQSWAIVKWLGDEDPDLFKKVGIEVAEVRWVNAGE